MSLNLKKVVLNPALVRKMLQNSSCLYSILDGDVNLFCKIMSLASNNVNKDIMDNTFGGPHGVSVVVHKHAMNMEFALIWFVLSFTPRPSSCPRTCT